MGLTRMFARAVADQVEAVGRRTKLRFTLGLAVAFAVFSFASHALRVPTQPGFSASLLGEPSGLMNVVYVALMLFGAVALSTLVVGRVRFDAGLFCGAAGMTVISTRGGRLGDLLRYVPPSHGPAIFITLAVELVVLYALVAVAWSALWSLHRGGYLNADEFRDGVEDTDEPFLFKFLAMLMQTGVTGLIVLLLVQADNKAQVLGSLAFASFVGAWVAYFMYPISPSPWLWAGPLVLGVTGYVLAYFNVHPQDDAWRVGLLTYPLAPLARPLPIDYATVGPAGALLGYWLARRSHRQRVTEAAAEAARAKAGPTGAPEGAGEV